MGHLDTEEENLEEDKSTIRIWWASDGAPEVFRGCTEVDEDESHVSFNDSSGASHSAWCAAYEVTSE